MINWWKKRMPLNGCVLFRGELPPRPDDFRFLESLGITITPARDNSTSKWVLQLSHPEWGNAQLTYNQDWPLPPQELLLFKTMHEQDKEAANAARSMVVLHMESKHNHILRDRKLMLRYLRAIMGSDGLLAIDTMPAKAWTREDLDDELCHDADLDIEGIINIHAIRATDDSPRWIHTHGLSEIGAFDFDIFNPSDGAMHSMHELCRALAFLILEGSIGPSTSRFSLVHPNGDIRLVSMNQFIKNTNPGLQKSLQSLIDDSHRQNHSVLCEPAGSIISRVFKKSYLEPVRFLTQDFPENSMFCFSNTSSNLMAERALNTYPMLRNLVEEFKDLGLPCLVKLGIVTDDGSDTKKEHLWFDVHELFDTHIYGTLLNQPYFIKSLNEGDQGKFSTELISDWMILTPVGTINPRSTTPARIIRSNKDEIKKLLEEENQ